jgi:hypothetical protein
MSEKIVVENLENKFTDYKVYGESLFEKRKNLEKQMIYQGIKIDKKIENFVKKLRDEFKNDILKE